MSDIFLLDTRFSYYFKIPECNSRRAITIIMAANNFQNARQRFGDSPLHDQEIRALESPFYSRGSCSFLLDNLQQSQQDHYYMSEQGSSFHGLLRQDSPLSPDMNSFGLGGPNYSNTSHGGYYYDYTNNQNADVFYNGTSGTTACPRNHQQSYGPKMIQGLGLSDPSLQCQLRDTDQNLRTGNSGGYYSRQVSMSRTPSLPDAASCKAEDDAEDDVASNTEESKIGEPYAKLIHRALMGAPSHSMALQEIYQWFIDNTEKGSSAGSGWRNSIRHNLSMNAVSYHFFVVQPLHCTHILSRLSVKQTAQSPHHPMHPQRRRQNGSLQIGPSQTVSLPRLVTARPRQKSQHGQARTAP